MMAPEDFELGDQNAIKHLSTASEHPDDVIIAILERASPAAWTNESGEGCPAFIRFAGGTSDHVKAEMLRCAPDNARRHSLWDEADMFTRQL